MTETTIDIAGLTVHGEDQHTSGALQFVNLIDWYSITESKSDVRERPQAHGAFGIADDFRKSAVISFDGWCECDSWAETLTRMREVRRALNGNRPALITVTDELGATSRTVSVRTAPLKEDQFARRFTFAVDMVAPDANRYGPAASVSTGLPTSGGGIAYPIVYPISYGTPGNPGRVITENPGDEDTYSLLEVTGGLGGGFELTEGQTGQALRFERVIPLGSTVFLNPRTGRAYLDTPGNDVSGFLTRREWWSVPAQGSREIQFASIGVVTGTPTLTARTSPAH
ncbi:hypothetical protein QMG61_05225 [Cryobacterium sp. PH31-AA6]|uniref:hypothetical protein n=1 Tax=Cryobacterium sp. PH31-AA6 TaxID=3046205 RepID=UPI0024B9F7D9|nr:hypothetical protein [Cryobacterium sp. PH31-AA6]MDJ0323164.1 hypothetical protein [Cryobacterium sp. PH31-AA6]